MDKALKYRGYIGNMVYSRDDKNFYGKVLGIKSFICYKGDNPQELEENFKIKIDNYLEEHNKNGTKPEKPFK